MVGGRARMKRCLHAPAVRTYCGQNRRIVTDESSSECIVRIVVVDGWCITSRSQRFGFIQQQMPAALRTHFFAPTTSCCEIISMNPMINPMSYDHILSLTNIFKLFKLPV